MIPFHLAFWCSLNKKQRPPVSSLLFPSEARAEVQAMNLLGHFGCITSGGREVVRERVQVRWGVSFCFRGERTRKNMTSEKLGVFHSRSGFRRVWSLQRWTHTHTQRYDRESRMKWYCHLKCGFSEGRFPQLTILRFFLFCLPSTKSSGRWGMPLDKKLRAQVRRRNGRKKRSSFQELFLVVLFLGCCIILNFWPSSQIPPDFVQSCELLMSPAPSWKRLGWGHREPPSLGCWRSPLVFRQARGGASDWGFAWGLSGSPVLLKRFPTTSSSLTSGVHDRFLCVVQDLRLLGMEEKVEMVAWAAEGAVFVSVPKTRGLRWVTDLHGFRQF